MGTALSCRDVEGQEGALTVRGFQACAVAVGECCSPQFPPAFPLSLPGDPVHHPVGRVRRAGLAQLCAEVTGAAAGHSEMRQSEKKEPPEKLPPVTTATSHLPSLQDFRLFALSPRQTQPVAAVTSRVGWVNYLKGFLRSFCCPNATLPEGSVHAGPVSVWLRTWMGTGVAAAVPPGMELSHRGGSGWAEPN